MLRHLVRPSGPKRQADAARAYFEERYRRKAATLGWQLPVRSFLP